MNRKILFKKMLPKQVGNQILGTQTLEVYRRGFGMVVLASTYERTDGEPYQSCAYTYIDHYEPTDAMRIGFALIRGGLLEALNNIFKRARKSNE